MDERVSKGTVLASAIVEALAARGTRRIFGIPGGGSSLQLIEAADRAGLDFVLTRTETAAVLMAAVTGELTGTPGVALTGIGPGAASAVNGVAYAWLEKAPAILLTDGPASSLHQAFDQNALFAPITKRQGRLRPESGATDIASAIDLAHEPPFGPVQFDLTASDAAAGSSAAPELARQSGPASPAEADIGSARRLLEKSRYPVVIAGLDARRGDAADAVRALVAALGCPALATYKAKGVISDTDPQMAGLFTGAAAEGEILDRADLIVLLGHDPVEMIPGEWRYSAPVLDITAYDRALPTMTPAVRLVGPLGALLGELAKDASPGQWDRAQIEELRAAFARRIALRGAGHTAESITAALNREAPQGTRLTVDAGAHMISTLSTWQASEAFGALKSNGLSTMGFAVPAAIASALHEPARRVVAVTGDGGMMMSLSELATAVEHGCDIVIAVVNDAALSLIDIKQQRQQYASRGVRYPITDFAACARALGCRAWRVGEGDALEPVVADAFSAPGPALIDIVSNADGYGDQLAALRG